MIQPYVRNCVSLLREKIDFNFVPYIAENAGQLDYYGMNPTVDFPCILVTLNRLQFDNIGQVYTKTPTQRQHAQGEFVITIADIAADNYQMTDANGNGQVSMEILDLTTQQVHEVLHGQSIKWILNDTEQQSSKLIRTKYEREFMENGVIRIDITYAVQLFDV